MNNIEKGNMSHIVAGLIVAAAGFALVIIYYYTGLIFESNYISFIPPLVTVILITLFVWKYGQDNKHDVTFGNLFGYGFRTTIIFALLMTAFLFVVLNFFHQYKEKYLEVMTERLNVQRNITNEQKESTMKITSTYFRSIIIGYNLFINLIAGTAGSLLGASVSKKDRQSPRG